MPRDVLKQMLEEKKAAAEPEGDTKQQQQQLDFKKLTGPREFTRDGVLHAVAKLIVTNNQVSQRFFAMYKLI